MSRSEKAILNETLVDLSALPDTLVWRNNTGQAWQGTRIRAAIGSKVEVTPHMVILRDARPITFGLPGSGDILGVSSGMALSVEVKADKGRQSKEQVNFQQHWERSGGFYLLTHSSADAVSALQQRKSLVDLGLS